MYIYIYIYTQIDCNCVMYLCCVVNVGLYVYIHMYIDLHIDNRLLSRHSLNGSMQFFSLHMGSVQGCSRTDQNIPSEVVRTCFGPNCRKARRLLLLVVWSLSQAASGSFGGFYFTTGLEPWEKVLKVGRIGVNTSKRLKPFRLHI